MAIASPEIETKSLPANAYLPLKAGESYVPLVPTSSKAPELTARAVSGARCFASFSRCIGLLGTEGRPGDGGCDSHLHSGHWYGADVQAPNTLLEK